VNIYHTDPFPQKVVKGKEDWYFLGDYYSNDIRVSKGINNFSKGELDWTSNNMIEFKNFLDKEKIPLYMIIVPNKLTIYGDYLPITKSDKPTKMEQLTKCLLRNGINLIDIKQALMNHRDHVLYLKADSHWNEYGAFYGYEALMRKIQSDFQNLKILRMEDFNITSSASNHQDLTRTLSSNIYDIIINFQPNFKSQAFPVNKHGIKGNAYSQRPDDYELRFQNKSQPLKVVIFRDSFFTSMIPWLNESFGETVFIWDFPDKNQVLTEKPDFVIFEIVERNL